ncbi:MAG: hypothetical protein HGA41_07970 [Syntrophaceae bacterium]|jgi:hypothetical protein|nr:hypothetical protein [Syntrophaceae bacterium]
MVSVTFASYPPESVQEFAKRFIAQPPMPAYITMKGPYVSSDVGVGIKTLVIYEFDKSKMAEAIQIITARYAKYFGVPGFTYSQQIWLDAVEALKSVGMG